jgi:hypothetical protein
MNDAKVNVDRERQTARRAELEQRKQSIRQTQDRALDRLKNFALKDEGRNQKQNGIQRR